MNNVIKLNELLVSISNFKTDFMITKRVLVELPFRRNDLYAEEISECITGLMHLYLSKIAVFEDTVAYKIDTFSEKSFEKIKTDKNGKIEVLVHFYEAVSDLIKYFEIIQEYSIQDFTQKTNSDIYEELSEFDNEFITLFDIFKAKYQILCFTFMEYDCQIQNCGCMNKSWFVYDPEGNGLTYFVTEQEAKDYALKSVHDYYGNECWDDIEDIFVGKMSQEVKMTNECWDDIEDIFVGKMSHKVKMTNKREDPSKKYDHICDYILENLK